MKIKNKAFFVTGGASGLGRATVEMLIAEGASVLIADVNEEEGNILSNSVGEKAQFLKTDVSSEQDVQQAIDLAVEVFGSLDGAINCAGIGPAERVLGRQGMHRLETFSNVVRVNLVGTFNVLRLAANTIQNNTPDADGERGVIINTASVAAYEGQIGQAAYAASKGGIVSMTLPIARELSRFGIRIMTIAPGLFETPLLANLPDEVKESLGAQVPFPPRLGQPKEYAALVEHILNNTMLNGEVIRLDGAIRMAAK